jgi:hypothetical protein
LQKLKNRIINFRVTDEELACLKSASDLQGARCLSDFARTVMLRTAVRSGSASEGDRHIEEQLHMLDCRLSAVESDLMRVMDMLSGAGELCRKT